MSTIEKGNSLITFEISNDQEGNQGYVVTIVLSESSPPSNGDTSTLLIQLPLEPNPLRTNYAFLDGEDLPIPNKMGDFDTTIPIGSNKYEISICGQSVIVTRVGDEIAHIYVDDEMISNYDVVEVSGQGVSNIAFEGSSKCAGIDESEESETNGLSAGIIAAIVISSLVGVALIVAAIIGVYRLVKKKRTYEPLINQ